MIHYCMSTLSAKSEREFIDGVISAVDSSKSIKDAVASVFTV